MFIYTCAKRFRPNLPKILTLLVGSKNAFEVNACETAASIAAMEAVGVPVIVGEWSLATDNCAMWLNGFQDNLPGYPFITCPTTKCPTSYMQQAKNTGDDNNDDVEFSKLDPSWGPDITQGKSTSHHIHMSTLIYIHMFYFYL